MVFDLPIAQLAERPAVNRKVTSSILVEEIIIISPLLIPSNTKFKNPEGIIFF